MAARCLQTYDITQLAKSSCDQPVDQPVALTAGVFMFEERKDDGDDDDGVVGVVGVVGVDVDVDDNDNMIMTMMVGVNVDVANDVCNIFY